LDICPWPRVASYATVQTTNKTTTDDDDCRVPGGSVRSVLQGGLQLRTWFDVSSGHWTVQLSTRLHWGPMRPEYVPTTRSYNSLVADRECEFYEIHEFLRFFLKMPMNFRNNICYREKSHVGWKSLMQTYHYNQL